MKKKNFNTSLGNVTVRFAMIDADGTNLCEGVEFKLDGKFIGEVIGLSLDEINEDNIEELVEEIL